MRKRVTEETVIVANTAFVGEMCRRYGRNIEPEDCMAVAQIGLLHAVRIYRTTYADFHRFAEGMIARYLQEERRTVYAQWRVNSKLSLNQRFADSNEDFCTRLRPLTVGDCASQVEFRDFLDSLEADVQATAWMLVDRYPLWEICLHRQISMAVLPWHLARLRHSWEEYSGEA
ncbi:hypothetical protein LJC04_04055 [Ruminococcaceae bacterium OttesenSCG-928-O06]|nr:hypothetical protein [Ruminococcaceae bacterium OttesenSCG-928-O06]